MVNTLERELQIRQIKSRHNSMLTLHVIGVGTGRAGGPAPILERGSGPPNNHPATYLSQAYAVQ